MFEWRCSANHLNSSPGFRNYDLDCRLACSPVQQGDSLEVERKSKKSKKSKQ